MPSGVYFRKVRERICPHPDRPYSSRGMCKPCYDAWYRTQNMQELKDYHKKQYGMTKAQLLAYHTSKSAKQRAQEKTAALALHNLDGVVRCSYRGCTVVDPDMLGLDHVNDDGRVRRKAGELRGNGLYRRAAKVKDDTLQTLCANHNLKKELMRRRESKG